MTDENGPELSKDTVAGGPSADLSWFCNLLVDALCGEEDLRGREALEVSSPGALYNYLSRLRRVLAATDDVGIARQPGGYVLTIDSLAVDLHLFPYLIVQARTTDDDQAEARLYARTAWPRFSFAA